jgi:hypothetical protein
MFIREDMRLLYEQTWLSEGMMGQRNATSDSIALAEHLTIFNLLLSLSFSEL